MSHYEDKIGRKDFISGCGKAVLGLGLGLSCGKGAEKSASAAQPAVDSLRAGGGEKPITPAFRSLGKAKY